MNTTKKILIIDDETDLSSMLSFQFKSHGFEVKTAGDGLAALEMVHQFVPDLIILDINMPRMGGVEFYSKICGSNGKPLYPVLVLTARANIQSLFKDLHIDGFIVKPFEINQLIDEASLIIRKKAQQAPLINPKLPTASRKICLVEDDPEAFDQLGKLFLNADYVVMPAKSGAVGLEKMMKEVPDVALVNLGLSDIPGDIVIYRLSQMSKTMDIKFILYTSRSIEHDEKVMERLASKTGIWTFVEYDSTEEILKAVNGV